MSNYLAQYDAAPDSEKFKLVRRWMDTEPLPFFAELREKRPVLVTPECTLLARFDDVTDVLNMPKVFTTALYLPKMGDGIYLMAHDDDALHTREKSIMMGLLNRDDLPKVRNMVADIAKGILDQSKGKIEVVYDYCRMVPARLVQDYFGLTGEDPKELIKWSYWNQYNTFHNQPFDILTPAQRKHIEDNHNACSKKLGIYIIELLARRTVAVKAGQAKNFLLAGWYLLKKLVRWLFCKGNEEFKDDIVSRMLRTSYPGEVDFNLARVGVNAGGLLIGSIETTSQAVSQVLQYLIERPELLAKTKAAAQAPDLAAFDGIVWEAMRYVPISPYLFRQCASTHIVGNGTDRQTTINPGTYVLPLTQSAMFDPLAFEAPEEFKPQRNWYHYFHFGFGSHECLGKYVGMVMIPEMVRQIMLRKDIGAQGRIDYKDGPFPESYELAWSGANAV